MSAKRQIVKDPWCVYMFVFFPGKVGKVEEEANDVAWVWYCERQQYPLSAWESRYLKRFGEITAAVREYARLTGISLAEAVERTICDFPSEAKPLMEMLKAGRL